MASNCLLKMKKIGKPNISSEDGQWWYRNGIWHRKMWHANNKKRKMTNDERNRTTISRKNQNGQRKGNLETLANTGSGHHQTNRGACGVIVIVVGNGHGDSSSNPGRDWLYFT